MKSAYELAMERLQAEDPNANAPLSEEKKQELAKIDEKYKAKFAEREVFLKEKIAKAEAEGKFQDAADIRKQLASEKIRIEEECESAKDKVRG